MFLQKIRNKIYRTNTGLLPLDPDSRDLGFWELFGVAYKPKHKKKFITPLTIKRQKFNTCSWNAAAGMKEIDEGVELSPRSIVIAGKQMGYISGDGFSTLRNNQKVLQKFGIAEKKYLVEGSSGWNDYSNPKYLTEEVKKSAAVHKIKSYLRLYNTREIFKALDEDRPVEIGIAWHTGFNMSGGFRSPWIIRKPVGRFVGGHAIYLCGYDLSYRGIKVFISVNSLGKNWGDNGFFYITPEFLEEQIRLYGAFINYDLDLDITKWLIQHRNKVVKGSKPDVYLIQDGKKRRFPDLATFYAYGYLDGEIIRVDDRFLQAVPDGEPLQFWQGDRVKSIKAIIQQRNNLKPIFKKYFNELF